MKTALAADEVIGAIAGIETQRRNAEKEAGRAAACAAALRKLHEILDREREALQQRGAEPGHPRNVEAVTAEIERVKALAVITNPRPATHGAYVPPRNVSWKNNARSPARNKGRKTMGRAGGR